ncbi:hypothetical protein AVEN_168230-1, partial [Araneus ventricosus]
FKRCTSHYVPLHQSLHIPSSRNSSSDQRLSFSRHISTKCEALQKYFEDLLKAFHNKEDCLPQEFSEFSPSLNHHPPISLLGSKKNLLASVCVFTIQFRTKKNLSIKKLSATDAK